MKKTISTTLLAALCVQIASGQTTLQLEALSAENGAPSASIITQPGQTVSYEVSGLLGGDASQGLCMFAFDVSFDGGDVTQMSAPMSGTIQQFVSPLGFNNPAGFGGTPSSGDLLQVGGGMNTIQNQFAPTPSGIVVPGFADGSAELLASGQITAPTTPGTYTLTVTGGFANALESQAPSGFWRVQPVEIGDATLTIEVLDCVTQQYCVGKMNSAGCVATIQGSGIASISGASTLTLTATDILNNQYGLFVFGRNEAQTPLLGGTVCVGRPLIRMWAGLSGGTGAFGTTCTGSFTQVIDSQLLTSNGFLLGETVHCQWYYRDPFIMDGSGAGLTQAARFTVCP